MSFRIAPNPVQVSFGPDTTSLLLPTSFRGRCRGRARITYTLANGRIAREETWLEHLALAIYEFRQICLDAANKVIMDVACG
jgi:hypothetical protein